MAFFLKTETIAPKTHTRRFSCRSTNAYRLLQVENPGLRFYSANLSRWINRDPIGERGGYNDYLFCANTPSVAFDCFGRKVRFEGLEGKGLNKLTVEPQHNLSSGQDWIFVMTGTKKEWGVQIDGKASCLRKDEGQLVFVQNVKVDSVITFVDKSKVSMTTGGKMVLDLSDPYKCVVPGIPEPLSSFPGYELRTLTAKDDPYGVFNTTMAGIVSISIAEQFKTFLMFKPKVGEGERSTLGVIEWSWSATMTLKAADGTLAITQQAPIPEHLVGKPSEEAPVLSPVAQSIAPSTSGNYAKAYLLQVQLNPAPELSPPPMF